MATKVKFKAVRLVAAEDAQSVGEYLYKLAGSGGLPPETVVERAQDPSSPIHRYFNWDDGEAARLYRVEQARLLCRSIHIVVRGSDGNETTRAFHAITVRVRGDDGETDKVYIPSPRVFSVENMVQEVLATALSELRGWQKRYEQYTYLSGAAVKVGTIVTELEKKLQRMQKGRKRKGKARGQN
jgi:hypothetical protein